MIKIKKKYGNLALKYPRISYSIVLVVAATSFFLCENCYDIFVVHIIPQVGWRFLDPFIKVAIMVLGYLMPLVIAGLLGMLKFTFLQLFGVFFGGIGLGVLVNKCLKYMLILCPYGR